MRTLAGIPDGYHVLFLQGGASLQFSMVPMNILPAGGSADYIVTGVWSQKAVKEAKRVGGVKIAAIDRRRRTSRASPKQERADARPGVPPTSTTRPTTRSSAPSSSYVPDTGSVPLVADTSSDMFSGPIDVSKFALIYAGAQKNLAPAGRHARHHPRRHAEADAGVAADDAAVSGARGEQVAVQHAAGVRDLRHAAGAGVAAEAGRARRQSTKSTRARPTSSTRRSIGPASIAAHAQTGQPVADERHVPAARAKSSRSGSPRKRPRPGSTG